MERPRHQLRLEGLVPADVPGIEDDSAHSSLVEQVGPLHLDPSPRAVAVLPAKLDRPRSALLEQLGVEGVRPLRVALGDERPAAVPPDQPVRLVTQDRLHRGTHVPDRAIGLENEDDVSSVLHQGPEPLLARTEPLLLGRQQAVGAPETDDPEAEPAHSRAAEAREDRHPCREGPMSSLQHVGIHAGGEPGSLAHLFEPGPRRDGSCLIEASREKQREGLVHRDLLHLHRCTNPARRPGAAVQTQDPVERADAALVSIERVQVEGEAAPLGVLRNRPASSAPRRGSRMAWRLMTCSWPIRSSTWDIRRSARR